MDDVSKFGEMWIGDLIRTVTLKRDNSVTMMEKLNPDGAYIKQFKMLIDMADRMLAAAAAPPAPPQSTGTFVSMIDNNFEGKNADGSQPFTWGKSDDGKDVLLGINMVGWNCYGPSYQQKPIAATVDDGALREAVTSALQGLYGCERVWSAWKFGAMVEEGFYPAEESEDAVTDVVDAVRAALARHADAITATKRPNAQTDISKRPCELENEAMTKQDNERMASGLHTLCAGSSMIKHTPFPWHVGFFHQISLYGDKIDAYSICAHNGKHLAYVESLDDANFIALMAQSSAAVLADAHGPISETITSDELRRLMGAWWSL